MGCSLADGAILGEPAVSSKERRFRSSHQTGAKWHMLHVYVPIALSFLVLIPWLIYQSLPARIDRAEVEEKGFRLLRSWLSPEQQWEALSEFEVVGSQTGTRYRSRTPEGDERLRTGSGG
jgi:hypothetical protein